MEVILKQDVEKVGKGGSVIKVKDGFGRNFLIPAGLAVPATSDNLKKLEFEKQKKSSQLEKAKKEAEDFRARLANLSLTIPVLTHEEDKLYAGITSLDLARALQEEGFGIDKNSIMLNEPIKSLGIYEVSIKLHQEITAILKVWIVKK